MGVGRGGQPSIGQGPVSNLPGPGEEQETLVSRAAHDSPASHSPSDLAVSPPCSGTSHTGNSCRGPIVSPLSSSVENQHFCLQEGKPSTEREALPSMAE